MKRYLLFCFDPVGEPEDSEFASQHDTVQEILDLVGERRLPVICYAYLDTHDMKWYEL